VPGNGHVTLPPGFARKLPKGATLRFQLHYTPNGTATTDQTRVAFRFVKEPPKHEVKVGSVIQLKLNIPPGADHHPEVAKLKVPTDVMVRSVVPHMHVRAKACRYELTTPDGRTTTLVDIPHYDFNWQIRYQFAEPIRITKGSTLSFTVWYDNSEKNPANPDPKATVKWGPQTWDEMHIGYVEYYVDRDTGDPTNRELFDLSKPTIPKDGVVIPEKHKRGLALFDKNNDGKLSEAEIEAMPEGIKQRVYNYLRN
jgi:Copper type II ascorbate-dependent monooxygenase, C-terminal domain